MSYLELISHRTHERPFSIHKTTVYPGMTLVLYLHCHSEMEIFYLNEGEITFVIEDREFKMTAGDAIFIPPNLLHSAYRKENDYRECSFSAFVFAKEMIMEYIPAYCERYFYAVQYQPFDCIISLQDNIIWRTSVIEFLNHIFSFQLENPEEYGRGD